MPYNEEVDEEEEEAVQTCGVRAATQLSTEVHEHHGRSTVDEYADEDDNDECAPVGACLSPIRLPLVPPHPSSSLAELPRGRSVFFTGSDVSCESPSWHTIGAHARLARDIEAPHGPR